jgi:hypothetical protein
MRLPGFSADAALYKMQQHYKTHLRRYDLARGIGGLARYTQQGRFL